jgi:transcriptional regulator with XRE-family HTH domain
MGMATMALAAPAGAAGVRSYLRVLREEQGYTQKEFGPRVGLSERAWIDYETGETQELKQSTLVRVLDILSAPYEDIRALILENQSADSGRALALRRLAPDVQKRIRELEETEEGRQALIDAARRHLKASDNEPPHRQ